MHFMSGKTASPLAAAFVWATCIAACTGVVGVISHGSADDITESAFVAAAVGGLVTYIDRKMEFPP
jgi:hypothetical protein